MYESTILHWYKAYHHHRNKLKRDILWRMIIISLYQLCWDPLRKQAAILLHSRVQVRYSHDPLHMLYGEACNRSIRNSTREIDEKEGRGNSEMRWEIMICR